MAERGSGPGREPVGSVAEETARLVEAFGGWAEGLRTPSAEAPTPQPSAGGPAHEQPPPEPPPTGPSPGSDGASRRSATADSDAGTRHTSRCEHCGVSSSAGEALACQLCPVCQGIALLRTVRPETVERLADLAAAVSGVLRDIAADRFGPPPAPPPPRGPKVQDISVEDEDDAGTAATGTSATEPAAADAARRPQESTAP